MSMNISSLSQYSFVSIERSLGLALETMVTNLMLSAGNEEWEHTIINNITLKGIPVCTVVVDTR